MRKITLAVCAHVDAGKTTFCEQLLYHGGRLRSPGAVDAGNTSLDHHAIEQQRGITVFADQSAFESGDLCVYLLDTPGHVDFSAEMERALQAADYALLLVSAVEGVQSHTRTVYALLKRLQIPAFFFINKLDRAGADEDAVRRQIASLTGLPVVGGTEILTQSEEWKEQLAGENEALMEAFFAGEGDRDFWKNAAASLFCAGRITPVFAGSALYDKGVTAYMDALPHWVKETLTARQDMPFAAKVYRMTRDRAGLRWYYLKIESGRLSARDSVLTPSGMQKVGEVRQCFGAKLLPVKEVTAGDLAAVCGITVPVGSVLGEESQLLRPMPQTSLIPFVKSAVLTDGTVPVEQVYRDFLQLCEEEPTLQVEYAAQTKQVSVCVMGEVQLEILQALVKERFGYAVSFGSCVPLYRETITESVLGAGHYEPLRHYAEVHLRIDPLPRGSGVQYASECSLERLGQNDQNLILTMLREEHKLGVLTGSPVTDLRITLLSGATHLKHTEGGDLKEAACRAFRQGLMKADSVLLEPWCRFWICVPSGMIGRTVTDMSAFGAELDPPVLDESGEMSEITGRAAAAMLFDYPKKLASFSGGKGSMRLMPDGYEPCGEERTRQAIEMTGYQPTADLTHSPDSIFCSHGAGFLVHWQDADGYMHIRL